ncbi:MAG: hypothetical protein JWQ54_4495 [Mucilaginibacter sp.]|nr:hypothetical protein [Mucilaginibacter sp.]
MNTELTPVLLGELINDGYTYVLVKQLNLPGENPSAHQVLIPVKQKPTMKTLPEGFHTFYKITEEPLQMACGNVELPVLVDLSEGNHLSLIPPSVSVEDFYFRHSEDFFSQVLESIDDYAVYTTNLEGEINSWNAGAKHVLGYTEKEIIGSNVAVIYTAEDNRQEIPRLEFEEVVRAGHAVNERYHVRKDGSQFWGSGLLFPLFDKQGNHRGYTKVMRNLAEKKVPEKQALYAKALSQNIIETSREPMAILNKELVIKAASESFFQLFQVTRKKAIKKSIYDFAPRLNRERLKELFEGILTNEMSFINFEFAYELADGSTRIMMIHSRKVVSFVDRVELVILSVEDITQERILQQDKDDFISIASHELKTPVTMIKASAQILEKELKDAASPLVIHYLKKLSEHVDKLVSLAAFLLDVSKIRTGRFSLQKEMLDLADQINETILDLLPVYHHTISYEGPPTCMVNADKAKIAQVLINLVSNAVKYSPDAGQVIIRLFRDQEKLTVSVQDFGLGISEEEQCNIFKRFSRTRVVCEKKIEGVGLGLYISAEIIKLHGGQIWFESKPNKGSTFFFSLPVIA